MEQRPKNEEQEQSTPTVGDLPDHSADIRLGRELLKATLPFAHESIAKSWWYVGSSFTFLILTLIGAGLAPLWPIQASLSILSALLMIRVFITYHDFMHGAILQNSKLARVIFEVYGAFMLTPPRSWKYSHNYHHAQVGIIARSDIGSFPLMTTKMWREATPAMRLHYRIARHPLTILFAYITIFIFSICLQPFFSNPKKHWDSAIALIVHFGLISILWVFYSFNTAFYVVILPMLLSCELGGYLFYTQHSFKRMIILSPEAWNYYRSAMVSSSYLHLNKVMQWFTGNIGYHHIHHLNMRIPFYRLPEAMAAIPELQSPLTTSLSLQEIIETFQANLWDEGKQRMVSYEEAKSL